MHHFLSHHQDPRFLPSDVLWQDSSPLNSPLDKNDDLELNNSDLASEDLKFMCMIGQLQWAVTLGRYEILAHVMSMSCFRLAPKSRTDEKNVWLPLKNKHYALKFRTKEPNYMHLPELEDD